MAAAHVALVRSALALVALVAVGCGPSKEEIAAVEATLAEAENAVPARERAFEAAMAARESVQPGTRACPAAPRARTPRPGSPEEKLQGQIAQMEAAHGAGTVGFTAVVRPGRPLESPHVARVRDRVASLRKELHERPTGGATRDVVSIKRRADELVSPSFWGTDLVVDVEREESAGAVDVSKRTFRAGAASGRAYMFDHAKGAIVCAGEFDASSSKRVEFAAPAGGGVLEAYGAARVDLDAQSIRAARDSLRAVR